MLVTSGFAAAVASTTSAAWRFAVADAASLVV
jgi:hypothetical protein